MSGLWRIIGLLRPNWTPVVSARAWRRAGGTLHVLAAQGAGMVEHRIPVPPGACPVSRNPLSGEVIVRYRPLDVVAEVVSLYQFVQGAASPGGSRNVEGLAQQIHQECRAALGVDVTVELTLRVQPGPQTYVVTFHG